MSRKSIDRVIQDHTHALMSLSGVVGTGRGTGAAGPCIKVFVLKRTSDLERSIGAEIEGYPVEIVETGGFRALEPE